MPALLLLGMLVGAGCGSAEDPRVEEGLRAFAQGHEAFAASLELETEARRPGGDPEAWKAAVKSAEDALAYWQWAAATRSDWPPARRNVERALLRMARLRERAGPKTPPKDEPKGDEETKDDPPLPPARPEVADLPPAKVLGLFDLLRDRERDKQRMRRAQRRVRSAEVERDW